MSDEIQAVLDAAERCVKSLESDESLISLEEENALWDAVIAYLASKAKS